MAKKEYKKIYNLFVIKNEMGSNYL